MRLLEFIQKYEEGKELTYREKPRSEWKAADYIDSFADFAEDKIAAASLVTTAAGLVYPPILLAAVPLDIASASIDAWQTGRSAKRGDDNQTAKNAFEMAMSLGGAAAAKQGAKYATRYATRASGKSSHKYMRGKQGVVVGNALSIMANLSSLASEDDIKKSQMEARNDKTTNQTVNPDLVSARIQSNQRR